MTLKEIVTVLGQSGLYKSISTTKNGMIVESLETGQRTTIPLSVRVSSLQDIAIFTKTSEKKLDEVFRNIREKLQGAEIVKSKDDPKKIKEFFSEIVPDFDDTKVYFSDMKKVVHWYHQLQTYNLLDLIDAVEEVKEIDKNENNDNEDVIKK